MPFADQAQTNYNLDWLAPNIAASHAPALAHTPGIWAWWDGSAQGRTAEIEVSLATAHATQLTPSTTQRGGHWYAWDPSQQQIDNQSTVRNSAFVTSPTILRASYLLLIDHYLSTGYTPAGTTVTEGNQIPIGWVPTLSVDPLNSLAIQNFWNAGPLALDAEPYRDQYQPGIPLFRRPLIYWSPVSPGTYILTGAGATLGAKSSG